MTFGPITGGTSGGGSGTVTSVSVASANGFAGSVANATTTPAITVSTSITGVLQGNGTAISAATTNGTGNVVLANSPTITTPTISNFTNATHSHLNTAGGGTITAAAISDFDTQVHTSRLDQMAAPSTDVSMNSHKITNLSSPTSAQDAVTKTYADAIASGLLTKTSCAYASTANITGTYVGSPTFTLTEIGLGALSIDGNTPSVNDRVLLKNQTSASQNGIYVVTVVGSAGASYVLTRATDFDSSAEILTGDYTFIVGGTTNAATGFILITPATITLDTTALSFTQFSSAAAYIAGAGLTLTSLTFDVGAGTGIVANADNIAVDTTVVATTSNVLTMTNKTLTSASFDGTAPITATQTVATSGSPSIFAITGGAHTTLAASTEATDLKINLARTVQFATGALTSQRAFYITAPTYAFVGASTLTTAATLAISNAPAAGTNATITNAYSLLSENGNVALTMSSNSSIVVDFLAQNTVGSARTVFFKSALTASSASSDFTFASTGTTRTAGSLFTINNNATARFAVAFNGATTITQGTNTSGSPSIFNLTGAAHTTLTASTEASDLNFSLARTVQFATGALATQRAIKITAPTYGFVAASTITTAATMAISGPPAAGTNATITNAYPLWIQSGDSRFDGSAIIHGATAIPAGGTQGKGILISSTANFGIFFGSGAPTLSAAQGSLYLRSDGSSTSTRMYVNTNGSTTWTNVTTAA